MADEAAEFGREVARLRLPLPVRGIGKLIGYLEDAYREGLVMHQEGEWMIVTEPL